jgi:hypothetical protein
MALVFVTEICIRGYAFLSRLLWFEASHTCDVIGVVAEFMVDVASV